MIISEKMNPWECPRCRSWNSPINLKCDCVPVKRDYCAECLTDAFAIFNLPFPSMDVIETYAEYFHKKFEHRNKDDNQ